MAADPYAVLGVGPDAPDDAVRAAYRARSMLLHPDLHRDRPAAVRAEAERAMAQLNEAYDAVTAARAHDGSGDGGQPGHESAFRRLGRQAARSPLTRAAAKAGERDGPIAYRVGWMMGRLRNR